MRVRQGFTLIELMVAMALTLFVMVIISQAFILALETFSGMKAVGDMQAALRTAATALRTDLNQDHFNAKRRVSDADFATNRPTEGFILLQSTGGTTEGTDPDGIPSQHSTGDVLYFTTKYRGNKGENFFRVTINDPTFFSTSTGFDVFDTPAPLNLAGAADATMTTQSGTFASPWAEVIYYLKQTGTTDLPNSLGGSGTPLFGLYRAQLVIVPAPAKLNSAGLNFASYQGFSCSNSSGKLVFLSPADLAAGSGSRSISTSSSANISGRTSTVESLVIPNVVSFLVQPLIWNASTGTGVFQSTSFDSTSSAPIHAVQVSVRVYDPKTQQTRQVTVVQDL